MNTSSHFVRALLFVGAISGFSHAHAGLRTNVLPNLQLDTSVGRQAGRSLVTVGTKWMF